MSPTVVVIGAGITGLSAAYEVRLLAPDAEIIVIERDGVVGGKLRSTPFAGRIVDEAADAFLARVPWALELCNELGLTPELVSPAVRSAFVWSYGALRRLPTGQLLGVPTDLDELADSGIVSSEGMTRALTDLHRVGPGPDVDITVGLLVRDRLGDEVLERMVEPLVGGINAGRADALSLQAVTPQIWAAAQRGGSLVTAAAAISRSSAADPDAPIFHAPVEGMARLAERLVEASRADIRPNTTVDALERHGKRWLVDPLGLEADHVIVTTPAPVAGTILEAAAPEVSTLLRSIDYASVSMITLALRRRDIAHDLDGSGFLVPAPERSTITACSFASVKWPHLTGDDGAVLLRVSAGSDGDERAMRLGDDELIAATAAELCEKIGWDGDVIDARVTRWPSSFPQYRRDHLELVDRIDAAVDAALPQLAVTGAAFRGLGVPACIRQGREAARHLLG